MIIAILSILFSSVLSAASIHQSGFPVNCFRVRLASSRTRPLTCALNYVCVSIGKVQSTSCANFTSRNSIESFRKRAVSFVVRTIAFVWAVGILC